LKRERPEADDFAINKSLVVKEKYLEHFYFSQKNFFLAVKGFATPPPLGYVR
jgi:hypothetical protein